MLFWKLCFQKKRMKTKLFLSNSEIVDRQFLDFCESHEISLVAKSLIGFEPVPYGPVPDADVVFFSSPRSVDFFAESLKGVNWKLASLGTGTAKRLERLGYFSDFTGSDSGKPETVAADFRNWLGNRKVIFPISSRSNRSVSAQIPEDQRIELIVYKTVSSAEVINPSQWYVFTSPSNVDAFLEKNQLPGNSKVIAWGETTAKQLLNLGIEVVHVLQKSDLRHLETFLNK